MVNPKRKAKAIASLLFYLENYFPNSAGLSPYSDDHKRVIRRMESVLKHGGRLANSIYRGFAKTTTGTLALSWAVTCGWQQCALIVGSSQPKAEELLSGIRQEWETNDLLFEDFPEVCYPFRSLEGKVARCKSQTSNGEQTKIHMCKNQLTLPSVPGSLCGGFVLFAYGLGGQVRGINIFGPGGKRLRTTCAMIDDPQNDGSADSITQVDSRLNVIRKGIIQSAGHAKKISVIVNGTVMRPNDVIDQLTTHTKNPSWESERIPMVKKWADAHDTLWQVTYRELRHGYDPHVTGSKQTAEKRANEFYAEHMEEMNKGCVVSWESCYDHESELSAIQHAYNLLLDDPPEVFESEYQQNPDASNMGGAAAFLPENIIAKAVGVDRGVVPLWAHKLTAFVDVQKDLLYWVVVAWSDKFQGHVIDYGTWPDQTRKYFFLRDANPTLKSTYVNCNFEGWLRAGLTDLTKYLLDKEWPGETDGRVHFVEKLLIDSGWGDSTDVVNEFCRTSGRPTIVVPALGTGIGCKRDPMSKWAIKPGEKRHFHALETHGAKNRAIKHIVVDTNFWKSFCARRFTTPIGNPGSLTLFKQKGVDHRLFADHMTAEVFARLREESSGREVDEWKLRPHKPDNHWWDCVVGSACAASIIGCVLDDSGNQRRVPTVTKPQTKQRVSKPNSFFVTART